jgi:hypothetical protein
MQYNKKQQFVRSVNGFIVPLRLLNDTHPDKLLFTDCFVYVKCFVSFEDPEHLEFFRSCKFEVGTNFIARDVTYAAVRDIKKCKFTHSFVNIWKNKGRLCPSPHLPEFESLANLLRGHSLNIKFPKD